jgi:hypothetical protein
LLGGLGSPVGKKLVDQRRVATQVGEGSPIAFRQDPPWRQADRPVGVDLSHQLVALLETEGPTQASRQDHPTAVTDGEGDPHCVGRFANVGHA